MSILFPYLEPYSDPSLKRFFYDGFQTAKEKAYIAKKIRKKSKINRKKKRR